MLFENTDYDKKANFVIERVFERGDVDDIRNGDEKVSAALLNAKFLPEHTMYLASAVINIPLKEFRCYILRQSNPGLFLTEECEDPAGLYNQIRASIQSILSKKVAGFLMQLLSDSAFRFNIKHGMLTIPAAATAALQELSHSSIK